MKLLSLFDGSGGFPLAASMCGIEPVYASEVEPYPIAVTRSRFPNMVHLGDVSKVHGWDLDPVDVITFGSPCQDMSIAGKRAGIKHEGNGDEETTRSGLFMEAVRIIKEMREATHGIYPDFAVWENVPGAFSSNKGEDFRTVLKELVQIVEPGSDVPPVPKAGWSYYDCWVGDGWSLAYRTFDAQYWGVPQRRRRIYLVLDLGGRRAGKVLFEREGLRRDFTKSGTPWQGTAGDAANRSGTDDCEGEGNCLTPWDVQSRRIFSVDGPWPALYGGEGGGHGYACVPYPLKIRSGCEGGGKGALIQEDKSATLATNNDQYLFQPVNMVLDDQGGQQITVRADGKAPTLRAETHGNLPCVLESAGFKAGQSMAGGIGWQKECAATLAAQCSGTEPTVCVKCYDARGNGDGQTVSTLTGDHENRITDYTTVICLQGNGIDRADTAGCNGKGWKEDTSYTLNTIDRPAVVYCTDIGFFNSQEDVAPTLLARQYKDPHLVSYPENAVQFIVRRLTPTECARLQGFPDAWGHPDHKEDFTDEEYRFWLNVRNTHAAINDKPQKDYTKAQMLTWYNKLHTDSSEYKMWGNGIALPNALYVMQGIEEAMNCHG